MERAKMSLFSKLRAGNGPELSRGNAAPAKTQGVAAMAVAKVAAPAAGTGVAPRTGRLSNGLKEFLWQLDGIGRGHLLDLGPARQTTITFFIERGFKVYTEDLLATWQYFLEEEAQRAKKLPAGADKPELLPEA